MTYIPGSVTEPNKRHDSYDELVAKASETQPVEAPSSKGYPKYRDDFSKQSSPIPTDLKREAEKVYTTHKEMLQTEYKRKNGQTTKKEKDEAPPHILNTIANFNLAKKLHSENLEHEPLPDTLTDALYRKLQMQKYEKDPGLALTETPKVTGVGWKGYPGYGPTRCTKLKVYRPKTGIPEKQTTEKRDGRPNSVSSFDKKWRFIRQSKVTPIELAICWDLAPVDPADEPKRPSHIDGSNGSLAPAVFSLVHTPKDDDDEDDISSQQSRKSSNKSSKSSEKHNVEPIFENLPKNDTTNEALPFLNRAKTARSNHSSSSKNSKQSNRARSACDLQEIQKEQNNNESRLNNRNEINKSVPNLSNPTKRWPHSRFCTACEMRNVKVKEKPKPEYKMAFKAGIPQPQRSVSTVVKTIFLKIPRPKDPYRKRNYYINSLAPPFSLQKDKKQNGYPEHWRLATVYQQSYRPIHARKRPLIHSVFK